MGRGGAVSARTQSSGAAGCDCGRSLHVRQELNVLVVHYILLKAIMTTPGGTERGGFLSLLQNLEPYIHPRTGTRRLCGRKRPYMASGNPLKA